MERIELDVGAILEGSLSRTQVIVIGLCVLVGFVDGFDTLAVAYAAPLMRAALHMGPVVLGWVFSAALLGGMAGMFAGSPLADRIGRRPVLIGQVLIFGVFTFCTAQVTSQVELLICRFLAGFGLGLAFTLTFTMVSEFVPHRLRVSSVAFVTIGYSFGAGAGGLMSGVLITTFGWQAIFYFGSALAAILLILLVPLMPESPEYLACTGKDPVRLELIARKIRPDLFRESRPEFIVARRREEKRIVAELFRDGRAWQTICLWLIFFMNLIELYSVQQWLPSIIQQSGMNVRFATSTGAVLQVGAVAGALVYGRIIDKFGHPFRLFVVLFLAGELSFVSLAFADGSTLRVMMSVFCVGMFVPGTQIALNGVVAIVYPPSARATGIGWAVSIGRIGGVIGPVLCGLLLARHWAVRDILLSAAAPSLIAASASYVLTTTFGKVVSDRMATGVNASRVTNCLRPAYGDKSDRGAP